MEVTLALARVLGGATQGAELVKQLFDRLHLDVEGVSPDLYDSIVEAAAMFGKRSGHPAKLNFGDCFSYAIAKSQGIPLLFKGDDFVRTDIERA